MTPALRHRTPAAVPPRPAPWRRNRSRPASAQQLSVEVPQPAPDVVPLPPSPHPTPDLQPTPPEINEPPMPGHEPIGDPLPSGRRS